MGDDDGESGYGYGHPGWTPSPEAGATWSESNSPTPDLEAASQVRLPAWAFPENNQWGNIYFADGRNKMGEGKVGEDGLIHVEPVVGEQDTLSAALPLSTVYSDFPKSRSPSPVFRSAPLPTPAPYPTTEMRPLPAQPPLTKRRVFIGKPLKEWGRRVKTREIDWDPSLVVGRYRTGPEPKANASASAIQRRKGKFMERGRRYYVGVSPRERKHNYRQHQPLVQATSVASIYDSVFGGNSPLASATSSEDEEDEGGDEDADGETDYGPWPNEVPWSPGKLEAYQSNNPDLTQAVGTVAAAGDGLPSLEALKLQEIAGGPGSLPSLDGTDHACHGSAGAALLSHLGYDPNLKVMPAPTNASITEGAMDPNLRDSVGDLHPQHAVAVLTGGDR